MENRIRVHRLSSTFNFSLKDGSMHLPERQRLYSNDCVPSREPVAHTRKLSAGIMDGSIDGDCDSAATIRRTVIHHMGSGDLTRIPRRNGEAFPFAEEGN